MSLTCRRHCVSFSFKSTRGTASYTTIVTKYQVVATIVSETLADTLLGRKSFVQWVERISGLREGIKDKLSDFNVTTGGIMFESSRNCATYRGNGIFLLPCTSLE